MDWLGAALEPIQVKLNSQYSVSQNKTIHPSLVYSFAKCCIQRPAEGVLWNFQGRWAFLNTGIGYFTSLSKTWRYQRSFRHNSGVLQTYGQTEIAFCVHLVPRIRVCYCNRCESVSWRRQRQIVPPKNRQLPSAPTSQCSFSNACINRASTISFRTKKN